MTMNPTDWHLYLGDELIAQIRSEATDFPWTYGKLINAPKFEKFRTYFSDEDFWPETPEFDDLIEEIHHRGKFSITNTQTDERFDNLRLNQDGDDVWFRYS
jgi:hypothetical protein